MGGGSTIPGVIAGQLNDSFDDECFTKQKCTYLRYFVILDSDKTHPGYIIPPLKIVL